MADWSKPALASSYVNFVTETNARDTDLAVMFDPAVVTPTNFPTNAIRWRAAANKWEKWDGTVWSDLAATYAIDISGTSANVTGIVDEANGGTGQSSYTIGDLLYASGAAALSKLAAVATGNALLSGGAATAPTWGKVGLTTHVSGTLPVANGGTGATTLTGVAYGNGTGAFTAATAEQLVAAIGSTEVTNATNATNAVNADTLDTYHASSFVRTVNGVAPTSGNVVVNTGVTSVNGNTGAVTAAQIAAAATAGYGYKPANGASYSPVGHTHSYAPADVRANVIGGICGGGSSNTTNQPTPGNTYTGSGVTIGSTWNAGMTVSGTWRCICAMPSTSLNNNTGLFQRIA